MTARTALMFGLGCLALGWFSAGWLEYLRAEPWVSVVVLFVLALIVAATVDRIRAHANR